MMASWTRANSGPSFPVRRLLVTVLATVAAVSGREPNSAHAQSQEANIAEALFREGQRLMKQGDLSGACDKFAASQQAERAIGTMLNLASCQAKMGKTASAWTQYSEALAETIRAKDGKREQYARAELLKLEAMLSRLRVVVASPVPALEATLDGVVLSDEARSVPFPVDPGTHTLRASAAGRLDWSKVVEIEPRPGVIEVQIPRLEETPGVTKPSSTEEAPPPPVVATTLEKSATVHKTSPSVPLTQTSQPASNGGSDPLYRRAWFWGAVAAVLVVGALGTAAATGAFNRDAPCPAGRLCR